MAQDDSAGVDGWVLRLWQDGVAAFRAGRPDDAARCFNTALAIWPQEAALLGNHAACMIALGHGEVALEDAEAAVKLKPESAALRLKVALALRCLGRHQESLEWLDAASAASPGDATIATLKASTSAEQLSAIAVRVDSPRAARGSIGGRSSPQTPSPRAEARRSLPPSDLPAISPGAADPSVSLMQGAPRALRQLESARQWAAGPRTRSSWPPDSVTPVARSAVRPVASPPAPAAVAAPAAAPPVPTAPQPAPTSPPPAPAPRVTVVSAPDAANVAMCLSCLATCGVTAAVCSAPLPRLWAAMVAVAALATAALPAHSLGARSRAAVLVSVAAAAVTAAAAAAVGGASTEAFAGRQLRGVPDGATRCALLGISLGVWNVRHASHTAEVLRASSNDTEGAARAGAALRTGLALAVHTFNAAGCVALTAAALLATPRSTGDTPPVWVASAAATAVTVGSWGLMVSASAAPRPTSAELCGMTAREWLCLGVLLCSVTAAAGAATRPPPPCDCPSEGLAELASSRSFAMFGF